MKAREWGSLSEWWLKARDSGLAEGSISVVAVR